MEFNGTHQQKEELIKKETADKNFVSAQKKGGYQAQPTEIESFLTVKEEHINRLERRLEELEDERLRLKNLIREKDFHLSNLKNQNKHLEGEFYKQNNYIQHVNNVNNELNKILTKVANELKGIKDARAVRIIGALRNFSVRKLLAAFSSFSIEANLDLPEGCETTHGTLVISGWAFTKIGKIAKVEAFLDEINLGEVFYGVSRPDVLKIYPSQSAGDYGFEASLSFNPEQIGTGAKTLKIRITNTEGNQREFIRLVIVESAKNLPLSVNPGNGNNRSCRGLATAEMQHAAYLSWIIKNDPKPSELAKQRQISASWEYRPLFSITTPVYNTPVALLESAIESVINQSYENWELCLVDGASTDSEIRNVLSAYAKRDSRIRVSFLDLNLGVSGNSNEAINMAQGEFIVLLNHDDELAANALYENALLLNQHRDADMIYSDEDKLDANDSRCEPYFKPDWSPDFFCSSMYTCHLGVYRKSLIDKIDGFRAGFDGAQDYDLVLRLTEQTDRIYHIPKVLYHWRKTEYSEALSLEARNYRRDLQIKAVSDHFKRLNEEVEVVPGLAENLLRVKRVLSEKPKVSIIIPTRDQLSFLQNCLNSIKLCSTYSNYEIIIVNNNSSEPETLKYFKTISEESEIQVIEYPHQFNFAAINNFAAAHAKGDLLLFLNNDTEVISSEWLEAMIEHAVRPEVGVVGARLLYPNGLIQHAGVIIGIGGVAGHSHKYFSKEHPGYFSRAKAIQNVSAVTAACMMVRKDVFEGLKGFDEKNLAIAYNDIDFCLRIRRRNLLIVYSPYAELYHYESISRGSDKMPGTALRFRQEAEYMINYWKDELQNDPYYNPNLTLEKEDFSIADTVRKEIY